MHRTRRNESEEKEIGIKEGRKTRADHLVYKRVPENSHEVADTNGAGLPTTIYYSVGFSFEASLLLAGCLGFIFKVEGSGSVDRYEIRQAALDNLEVFVQYDLQVRVELTLHLGHPHRHDPRYGL